MPGGGYVSASVAVAGRRPHSGCSLGRPTDGDAICHMAVGGLILHARGKLIGHLGKQHTATLAANIEFAQTLARAAMPVNHVTT